MTLRNLRKFRDVNQEDVARYLGISQSYYSQLENGKRRLSVDHVKRLAKFFGMPEAEIKRLLPTRGAEDESDR